MKRIIASLILSLCSTVAFGAACSVSEFTALPTDANGRVMQIPLAAIGDPTTQLVTATTSAAVTNPFGANTRYLWVYCDEVVHWELATSPTATTSSMRIPAGGFWLAVVAGQAAAGTLKIALCDIDCS